MKTRFIFLTIILFFSTKKCFSADFDMAFETTMFNEGGETFTCFHYDQDGGGTKYGISLKFYKSIAIGSEKKKYDNDHDGIITKNDLRLLTMGGAKKIYRKYFWAKVGGDDIRSQMTAEVMYDYLINGGFSLKKVQILVGVPAKGTINNLTVKAINQQPCKVTKSVLQDRGKWLFTVMKRTRPETYLHCKRGWANRVNRFIKQFKTKCYHEKLDYFIV